MSCQSMAPCQDSTFFDFFYIFKKFDNEKLHFWCGCTQLFGILPCSFFLNKASICGDDHKREFSYHFYPLLSVLVVQIWITCIKCKKAVNHLNIANEPRKMSNLHNHDFIAYVEHTKKIMFKQRRYLNYLSKFKRFPLETTNLHRRWLDLWRLYIAKISKPS